MHLHRSNRAEMLVEVLAGIVARPVADPIAPECIVVQGRGMERWLSMQLASRIGVWANPEFPFPRHLIVRILRTVLGEDEVATACFEPETLMWSIADLLPRHLERPEFTPIRKYLVNDSDGIRRIQLAERIARTFDQYVVFRPQMVLRWEQGDDGHWQAVLWRALVQRHGSRHIAARAREFLDALARPDINLCDLPSRVSVFGISALAPLYLQMLSALSRQVELHLFLLSPSPEFWADIRSQRELLRQCLRRGASVAEITQALHYEDANPLLASLGRVGRDFQQVLESIADYQENDRNLYVDPGPSNMLTTLQSDILSLRRRNSAETSAEALPLDPDDDSIAIHPCHGPMREVEVLHDQLLALFERDPTLDPRHVVVMSPTIDAYAPFIDAVFGSGSDDQPRIPYRIADRAVRATDGVIAAFLTLISVLRGRLTASEVLDLLGLEPVRVRFGLVAEDLDLLRAWIKESAIRWGVDSAHRQLAGQPPLMENTWRFGLDRLLLGYAMPGEGRRLYGGVLPYDDIEGGTAELVGRLAELCESLFLFQRSLEAPRALDAWRDDLGRLLHGMIASTNETAHQHREIHAALAELATRAAAGQFRDAVDLDIVQMQLAAALERGAPGRGFLTGGVTFCALVPMRSIPFRVVCLLGMNDGDFPRVQRPLGFDLMAQRQMPGDRSSRDDDRYLFLEALLSARERLIITYIGQSIRDDSEVPPSVVVSELLDALGESFQVTAAPAGSPLANGDVRSRQSQAGRDPLGTEQAHEAIRQRLTVRHPLQPFSPRYFDADGETRLFSYTRNNYEGARALVGDRIEVPPFLPTALAPGSRASRELSLDALVRFFENPTRAFLQNRLSLYLGSDIEMLDDREPLALDSLERWKVGSGLLERAVQGEDLGNVLPSLRASGALPPGVLGKCFFEDLYPEIETLATQTRELTRGTKLKALVVAAELDDTRIIGVIRNLHPAGQVRYQFSKLGGRHELGVWIRHLVLNWLAPDGCPHESFLIGRAQKNDGPTTVRFRPVDDAAVILRELLSLYWLGQNAPLLLFERASRAYTEALQKPPGRKGRRNPLSSAQSAFDGSMYSHGDSQDEYVQQVFAAANPLDPDFRFDTVTAHVKNAESTPDTRPENGGSAPSFAEVAVTVFMPMLEHREELP